MDSKIWKMIADQMAKMPDMGDSDDDAGDKVIKIEVGDGDSDEIPCAECDKAPCECDGAGADMPSSLMGLLK